MMNNYYVIYKLRHKTVEQNPEKPLLPTISPVEAESFAEAEKIMIDRWTKLDCECTIVQITIAN